MNKNIEAINHSFNLNGKDNSNFIEASTMARHRWYYYKEGFSPSLVQSAIDEYSLNSSSTILDPFNGSGTVTLTASERGIQSYGIEINPFTAFVARTKSINTKRKTLGKLFEGTYKCVVNQKSNPKLEKYSTFTELSKKDKWLFNLDVLRSFNGGYSYLRNNHSNGADLIRLALIASIMEVSNARKDGKCMKYKQTWKELNFSKSDFESALIRNFIKIDEDLKISQIREVPIIVTGDSRKVLDNIDRKFDLIITSPPYLNTFDYTDIYRPELFLGNFVDSSDELYRLRYETIRSHIQVNWAKPNPDKIQSYLLEDIFNKLQRSKANLMDDKIPLMVLAYFEDMGKVFKDLNKRCKKKGHLWMVVSNSAYANIEIPVDLILADIATKNGWKLSEIGVLRHIKKRKTRHSPDISLLRESVIILEK